MKLVISSFRNFRSLWGPTLTLRSLPVLSIRFSVEMVIRRTPHVSRAERRPGRSLKWVMAYFTL